jgi:hypothetical protein
LGNTPSVALRPYVDPTEAAFDRALTWRPAERSGAKSGALQAQNEAQRVAAENPGDSQGSTEAHASQASPPNPSIPRDKVNKNSL